MSKDPVPRRATHAIVATKLMHVVHVHVDLPPHGRGGVAYQVDLLARSMAKLGHTVRIVSTTRGPSDAPYDVDVVGRRLDRRFERARRQGGVALAFRRAGFYDGDAVHTHGDDWLLPGHVRRVRTFYGSAIHESRTATSFVRRRAQQVQHRLEHRAARLASVGVAISEHTALSVRGTHHVVPCAVDDDTFGDGHRSPTPAPSVLYVAGSLGGRKRGQVLLDAFQDVRRRWPDSTLHLVTRDEVEMAGVRCYANLSRRRLADLYLTAWVFASPSAYEGFGVPYAESMTAGLPIVATHNPGADEVLKRGTFGVLTEVSGFSDALVGLLGNPERRYELAEAARAASRQYSSTVVASRYLELYRELG